MWAWYLFATPVYDRWIARQRTITQGKQGFSDRVVVLVIYPSDGLLDSHIMTLKHIAENGYCTLLVSNLDLSKAERDRISPYCWHYIERPNFGYDFGGYRDGVLFLQKEPGLGALKRLVLMNDSAWYPLPETKSWLHEAEKNGSDLVGAVSNYGTPRIDWKYFKDLTWDYSTTHRSFHYCSFALSFGPNILQSPDFAKFWQNFRLDNDKKRVVRRGEIGATQWVIKHGFTHIGTCNPGELANVLAGLDDMRLERLVRNLIFPEDPKAVDLKQQLLAIPRSDPAWRHTMTSFVLVAASRQGTSYALADLTTKELGFQFLKKSPVWLNKDASDITIRLAAELHGAAGQIILQEIHALRQKRAAHFDNDQEHMA